MQFEQYSEHVNALVRAALAAADPATAVARHLVRDGDVLTVAGQSFDLNGRGVFLVSVGKAAVPMARAALARLGAVPLRGVVVSKKTAGGPLADLADEPLPESVAVFQAGHPVPDADSVAAAEAVVTLLAGAGRDDLVLCLISGGASALLARPLVALDDWQALTGALLASGCTINELNSVRRVLDDVKGGGLLRHAAPAITVSLILSDVIGSPLEAIGSGPTVPVADRPGSALQILERYDVARRLDPAVWERILSALKTAVQQPVEPFPPVVNVIVGDLVSAARAALAEAIRLGFVARLLTVRLEGEAREVGRVAAALAQDLLPGHAWILGGETTVTLRGAGRGGRNQELALAAAVALEGVDGVVVATFATDGEDGPTDAAGAVVTGATVGHGRDHRLDARAFLDRNDSYSYFAQLDTAVEGADGHATHLRTGSTGTNVNDLLFILRYAT